MSDEWYTPKYIFDAMGVRFDMDVAHPDLDSRITPCDLAISSGSLSKKWVGFVWMNPPFGGRNSLAPWLDRFFDHGCGVALTPDRTSAPWFKGCLVRSDGFLLVSRKVKFLRPDGSLGKSPSCGTTLWASGNLGVDALVRASENGLGTYCEVIHHGS